MMDNTNCDSIIDDVLEEIGVQVVDEIDGLLDSQDLNFEDDKPQEVQKAREEPQPVADEPHNGINNGINNGTNDDDDEEVLDYDEEEEEKEEKEEKSQQETIVEGDVPTHVMNRQPTRSISPPLSPLPSPSNPSQNNEEDVAVNEEPPPTVSDAVNAGTTSLGDAGVEEPEEREFVVEKVLEKKLDPHGFAKYLVKWEGYPSSENSWEPLEHLVDCDKMMQKYELSRAQKLAVKMTDARGVVKTMPEGKRKLRHGTRKYEVGDIMGITEAHNEKYYLINLANSTQKTFIRASLAKKIIPSKIIDFYLKNLHWKQRPQT